MLDEKRVKTARPTPQASKTLVLTAWEWMEAAGRRVTRDARQRPVFYWGLGTSLGLHLAVLLLVAGWTVARTPVRKVHFAETMVPFSQEVKEPEAFNELEAMDPTAHDEEPVEAGGGGALPGSTLAASAAFAALSALPPAYNASSMVTSMSGALGGGSLGNGSGSGMGSGRAGKVSAKTGKLFGRVMQSGNEGVVVLLDVSGSMAEASGKVRAMVEREFSDALVIELSGALFANQNTLERLRRERGSNDYYLAYYTSMLPKSVVTVVTDLLKTRAPESVYFLSDYQDYVDDSAVRDLGKLLSEKGVKFFAHTVDADPDGSIKSLCRTTGGDVLKDAVE